ncbi:hypothetical protein BDY21DRAFT_55313 [Lineolata rhizophorae]|uniref:Uncharacterized protein n=1 Tax=Lineolata rhizophorae TaxID=578093 RepID=A0A6A6NWW9_9PEZI|nr:hypothetical protein BDY21DRAFT_55313 [Lineolata rhizophorae]
MHKGDDVGASEVFSLSPYTLLALARARCFRPGRGEVGTEDEACLWLIYSFSFPFPFSFLDSTTKFLGLVWLGWKGMKGKRNRAADEAVHTNYVGFGKGSGWEMAGKANQWVLTASSFVHERMIRYGTVRHCTAQHGMGMVGSFFFYKKKTECARARLLLLRSFSFPLTRSQSPGEYGWGCLGTSISLVGIKSNSGRGNGATNRSARMYSLARRSNTILIPG